MLGLSGGCDLYKVTLLTVARMRITLNTVAATGVRFCAVQTALAVLAGLAALTGLVYGAVRFAWEYLDRRSAKRERAAHEAAEKAAREAEQARAQTPRLETFNLVDMERETRGLGLPSPGSPFPLEAAGGYGVPRRSGRAVLVVAVLLIVAAAIVLTLRL